MTGNQLVYFCKRSGLPQLIFILLCLVGVTGQLDAATISPTCGSVTQTGTVDNAMFSYTYPGCVCVGDVFTVVFTIEFTSAPTFLDLANIAPDGGGTNPNSANSIGAPGLAVVLGSQTGPNPAIPGSTYSLTTLGACSTQGGGDPQGVGDVNIPNGSAFTNVTYTYSYQVQAVAPGIQQWNPNANLGFFGGCTGIFGFMYPTILVNERATVTNESIGPICENTTISGTLPTAGNFTGPYFYAAGGETGGMVVVNNPTGGTFTFTPTQNFSGTAYFQYNIYSTGPGLPQFCPASPSGIITIPVAELPITSNVAITGCGGVGIAGNLVPFVTGGSGTYTFSSVGMPDCLGGMVSVNPGGTFTFTGPFNTGAGDETCDFVYLATDTAAPNCSSTGLVTATIFPSPVATDQAIAGCVNTSLMGTLAATGGTGTYTSFVITIPPANGTITAFNSTTGDFTYTPNTNFTGFDSFEFVVTDSNGCMSAPGTVSITVSSPPVVSSTAFNGCENTTFSSTLVPLVTGGTGAFSFSQTGAAPTCGGVLIFADGTYTFSPNFGTTGPCSFQYTVSQGGCPATGAGTVTVNIQPAPIATGANTGICASGIITDNLNNYVISAPGTVSFTASPGVNGMLNLNPAGPFTFIPTGASGTAGFTFRVMSSVLPCLSAPENYTITVFAPPTVNTGTISACSATGKMGSLVSNIPGGTPPFVFDGPITESGGTVVVNSNGTFVFTPAPGATMGSFTYGVIDGHGCHATGTELVNINQSPVATNGSGAACAGLPTAGSLTGLVSGGMPPYIFAQAGPSFGGSVFVSSNGNYIFTPSAGSTGGHFVFRATDASGCAAQAEIIVGVNPGPSAMSGTFTGCGPLVGSLLGLVTGPNPPFIFTGPFSESNGLATVNPDGTFSFTPTIFVGQGGFTYEVSDSGTPSCTSAITPVTIIIEPGPEALPSTFDTCENTPLFMSGLAPYVTGGTPPYTFSEVPPPPVCGTVTVAPNGTFTFTPTVGFSGPCSFVWQVADSTPCVSNTAAATINVHPTPVAADSGPIQACQGNTFTGNLNPLVSVGTPPYTFIAGPVVNGTLNLFPTGPYGFTPGFVVGPASFQYSATDTFGCMSNTGTVSFNVNASPTLTGPDPLNTCQNNPVSSVVTAAGGVPPYTFSVVDATNGTAVITGTTATTASYTFTPTVTMFPTPTDIGTVTLQVTDSNPLTGGCFGQVTITINIHQDPVVSSTAIAGCSGSFMGSLVPFVTGGVPPYFFAATGGLSPSGCGTVIIGPLGNYIFTSPSGFVGPCTFDFQVTDNSVSHCTSTGSITVNVALPFVAMSTEFCSCANTPVSFNLNTLISGGTPPYTFAIVGGTCTNLGPQITSCTVPGGTVVLNRITGQVAFRPNQGFLGSTEFMFQATDSRGCVSNVAMVTIVVPCCPTGTA